MKKLLLSLLIAVGSMLLSIGSASAQQLNNAAVENATMQASYAANVGVYFVGPTRARVGDACFYELSRIPEGWTVTYRVMRNPTTSSTEPYWWAFTHQAIVVIFKAAGKHTILCDLWGPNGKYDFRVVHVDAVY